MDPLSNVENLTELIPANLVPTFPKMPEVGELGHIVFERIPKVFHVAAF